MITFLTFMAEYETSEELEQELGAQIRAARLRRNLTQEELAAKAGVSRVSIRSLEKGDGSSVQTFVRVLKALGLQRWISGLQPEVKVSPLQMLRSSAPRLRVRHAKRPDGDEAVATGGKP